MSCYLHIMHKLVIVFYIIFNFYHGISAVKPCVSKDFGKSSFVCVCNSTYCDEYGELSEFIQPNKAFVVTSDEFSKRFYWNLVDYSTNDDPGRYEIVLDETETFQEILGFGGAFTDSAGYNINLMEDPATRTKIIEAYYAKNTLDYSLGRINMGGCDFSTRPYTHVDTKDDIELETFQLQDEDLIDKIPLIKMAKNMRPVPLKLYASPWSAPSWMKSNDELNGKGYLLPEYYQAWANYFIKFLKAYEDQGITFWGLTAQNEPLDGNVQNFTFNAMGWNSSTQAQWIVENLGPTLEVEGYSDIKLMILDDQRPLVPKWAREVFAYDHGKALQYVSGVGVHWYADDAGLAFALDQFNDEFPEKFILYTEACNGDRPWDTEKVMLGDWNRGEKYLSDIIENINHWSVGWTDWNLALDLQGGPNWAGNFVDAPIIVDPENGMFYKQPMYYALGHISRFLTPGSVRIGLHKPSDIFIEAVAVKMPLESNGHNTLAVVILNRDLVETVKIRVKSSTGNVDLDIGPRSFTSIVLA